MSLDRPQSAEPEKKCDPALEHYYQAIEASIKNETKKLFDSLSQIKQAIEAIAETHEGEEPLSISPNRVVLRLVLDVSASMSKNNVLAQKQTATMLLEATENMTEDINESFNLNTPFRIDTEIQIFDHESITLYSTDLNQESNKAAAIMNMSHKYGTASCQADPLWKISDQLQSHAPENEANFVLTVSDDPPNMISKESNAANAAHDVWSAVDVLSEQGVKSHNITILESPKNISAEITKPLDQLTETDLRQIHPRAIIDQTWGEKSDIIDNPQDLPKTATQAIDTFVKGIQFKEV